MAAGAVAAAGVVATGLAVAAGAAGGAVVGGVAGVPSACWARSTGTRGRESAGISLAAARTAAESSAGPEVWPPTPMIRMEAMTSTATTVTTRTSIRRSERRWPKVARRTRDLSPVLRRSGPT